MVDSLQPELRWKLAAGEGVIYDVAVWDSGLKPEQPEPWTGPIDWGTLVYQREGITGGVHQVEVPFKPNTLCH